MTVPIRFDQLPPARQSVIRANLATMQGKGAPDADVESYLRDVEHVAPAEDVARPGVGSRLLTNLGTAVRQVVTHPIDTVAGMVKGAATDLGDALLTPEVGEARHDPRLSKGGNSAGLTPEQIAQPYDAAHGAQPKGNRNRAAVRTLANIAFPEVAGLATKGALGLGANALLSRAAGAAAGGGVVGAVNSPDDPVVGALTGAVMAPVIGEGARGAAKVVGRGATTLGLRPSGRSAAEMAQDAATLKAPVGPQAGSAAPVVSAESSAPTAGQRVRAAIGSGVEKTGVESSKTLGLRLIAKRFADDNVTPADAVAFARNNPGKPVAPLDLGAGNVYGLARTAKDVPGVGRKIIPQFLHERSSGGDGATLQRVTQDIEHRIGLKPENYYANVDDMIAQQKSLTKPAYDKVRNLTIDDPEVLSLFDIPEFRGVHKAVSQAERIRPNGAEIKPLSEATTVAGESARVQNPQTLGTLDKMRQYVGDVARGKLESKRIDRNTARAMLERLDAATARLDELHPDYAAARAGYGGRARMLDAYEAGKSEFLTTDPREVQAKLGKMPEAEADLYRRGGYDELRAKKLLKMDDGSNVGAFLEKNPDIRARVAALAKAPGDATALRGDLSVERAMGERKNQILGGPNSAERIIEHGHTVPQATAAGSAVRLLPHVGHLLGSLTDNAVSRRIAGQTSDVMGEVAKRLVQQGPNAMQQLMDDIAALQTADSRRAVTGGRRAAYVAGAATRAPESARPR